MTPPTPLPAGPSDVRIERTSGRFQLVFNEQPFFIKGAVARGEYLPSLADHGANSVRTGPGDLDRAAQLGLTVLVNLPIGKPRKGFDYNDPAAVRKQLDTTRELVARHKDHPAVLAWALGNELEIFTTPEQRRLMWRALNDLAEMIHQLDGRHPVITVMGCDFIRERMLEEAKQLAPALDAMGLNAYNDMLKLPEHVADQRWDKPYLVTEFGPRGHWQVPRTAWQMPIEDTSSEKADFYRRAYLHAIQDRPHCLGSYVFYWAHKQEKTHTWYGMVLPDGSLTETADVMHELWTGRPPANRAPQIRGRIGLDPLDGASSAQPGQFPPGTRLRCRAEFADPDGDAVTVTWDLRVDVADDPNVGGDREPSTAPIDGAIESADGATAVLRLPQAPGNYRLFVYAHDGKGKAATANEPLRAVES